MVGQKTEEERSKRNEKKGYFAPRIVDEFPFFSSAIF